AQLNPRRPTPLSLRPDADARARIAADLDLSALKSAAFEGQIAPVANDAWELTGRLTARVVQPCVITLAPVETAIDESVRRVFSPHATQPEGDEVEMPDDEVEPLGQVIDAGAILVEALALAVPEYPRCADAALPENAAGQEEEDRRRPFAGLGDLLARKDE
ncbi:MAG TPA: DUF177 domain-containing protein, partial [Paracoccus sp. (in: a-proteobacteria)]|nr:DUF177 domain-containing protein [Paracoccus sp. (in: a-proteobacteria)]